MSENALINKDPAGKDTGNTNIGIERVKYISAVVLYGTIGMFLRYVSVPSEIVAMCRGIIGSIFILLYLRSKHRELDWNAINKNLKWLLIAGICLGLNWIFLFAAYMHTTVAIASLCNYMAPVIVILISPIVLHEKQDIRKIPYVIIAFIGIFLVSGVYSGALGNVTGVIMGLLAAVSFVVIVICNRKLQGISAYDKSVVQLLLSAVTILPYALIKNVGTVIHVDLKSILIILMLGLVHTGFAYCLYFSGMSSLPIQTVAILGYLEPVVSVLCSAFFLHEAMSFTGWIGAAMILGASYASESRLA